VVDLQDGTEGDETPVCVGGRGAAPPQYSGDPTGYRLMLKRQERGEHMFEPAQVETAIGVLAAAHPDRPASTWELLRVCWPTVPKAWIGGWNNPDGWSPSGSI
jgi:hypothetical protein